MCGGTRFGSQQLFFYGCWNDLLWIKISELEGTSQWNSRGFPWLPLGLPAFQLLRRAAGLIPVQVSVPPAGGETDCPLLLQRKIVLTRLCPHLLKTFIISTTFCTIIKQLCSKRAISFYKGFIIWCSQQGDRGGERKAELFMGQFAVLVAGLWGQMHDL